MTDPGKPTPQAVWLVIILLFIAALIPNLDALVNR